MTIRTSIEVDVATFNQQIAQVKRQLDDLTGQVKGGTYALDTSKAVADVEKLTTALNRLELTRDHALNNSGLSNSDMSRVTRLLNQSAQTIQRVNTQSGSNAESDSFRTAASENEQLIGNRHNGRVVSASRQRMLESEEHTQARFSQFTRFASSAAGTAIGGGGPGSLLGSLAGALPGPLGMVGGIVGGALGGKVDQAINTVGNEAVSYHELRNNLGNAAVDFEQLRVTVRELTEGFGITHEQAVSLATQFAKTSAASPDSLALGQSVHNALQFSRGYGLEPEAGTQFFAAQQRDGVITNEADQRRLGLHIAEAVARGGSQPKMAELLAVFEQFSQKTATQSLTTPDMSGFISLMGTLTSSSITGLAKNPGAAGQLLNQADEGLKHSSSLQDKELFLSAMQRHNPNFSALDAEAELAGGLFASPKSTFGDNSAHGQLADHYQDTLTKNRYASYKEDSTPNIQLMLEEIMARATRTDGSVNTVLATKIAAQSLKMGEPQSAALLHLYTQDREHGFGELETNLQRYGYETNTLKPQQLGVAAELLVGDVDANMHKQFQQYVANGVINKADTPRFEQQEKTDPEAFKKALLKVAMANTKDEGERFREANTNMARDINKLATELLPLTITIKEGIVGIARFFGTFDEKTKRFVDEQDGKHFASTQHTELSGKTTQGTDLEPEQVDKAYELVGATVNNKDNYANFVNHYVQHPKQKPKEYEALAEALKTQAGTANTKAVNVNDSAYALPLQGITATGKTLPDTKTSSNILNPYLEFFLGKPENPYVKDTKRSLVNKDAFLKRIKQDKSYITRSGDHADASTEVYLDYFKQHYDAFKKDPEHARTEFLNQFKVTPNLPAAAPDTPSTEPPSPPENRYNPPSRLLKERLPEEVTYRSALDSVPPLAQEADVTKSPRYKSLTSKQRHNADLIIAESARQGRPEFAHYMLGLAMTESGLNDKATIPVKNKQGQIVDRAVGLFQFTGATARHEGIDPYDNQQAIQRGIALRIRDADTFGSMPLSMGAHLTGSNLQAYRDGEFPTDRKDQNGTSAAKHAAKAMSFAEGFVPPEAVSTPPITEQNPVLATPKPLDVNKESQQRVNAIPPKQLADTKPNAIPLRALERDKASAQQAQEKQVKIQYAPLSLDVTLRDPMGTPLTERMISSQFGNPKPVGMA